MHAPQSPFSSVERDVALDPASLQAMRIEFALAVRPSEVSPVVKVLLWFNEEHTLQRCFRKNNCQYSWVSIREMFELFSAC